MKSKKLAALMVLIGVNKHLSAEQKEDLVHAAYQTAPGAGTAVSFSLFKLPLSDILVLLSMAFIFLQAAHLIWKWRRDARRENERQQRNQVASQTWDDTMTDAD